MNKDFIDWGGEVESLPSEARQRLGVSPSAKSPPGSRVCESDVSKTLQAYWYYDENDPESVSLGG